MMGQKCIMKDRMTSGIMNDANMYTCKRTDIMAEEMAVSKNGIILAQLFM